MADAVHVTRVAIVGGGLAGLYAAHLLRQAGIHDHRVLEARPALGGRLLGLDLGDGLPAFDLGATWFWPDLQPQIDAVLIELGLERFAQPEDGDLVLERSRSAPPVRMPGYPSSPPSMRLAGGMGALVAALRDRLDPATLLLGRRVTRNRTASAATGSCWPCRHAWRPPRSPSSQRCRRMRPANPILNRSC